MALQGSCPCSYAALPPPPSHQPPESSISVPHPPFPSSPSLLSHTIKTASGTGDGLDARSMALHIWSVKLSLSSWREEEGERDRSFWAWEAGGVGPPWHRNSQRHPRCSISTPYPPTPTTDSSLPLPSNESLTHCSFLFTIPLPGLIPHLSGVSSSLSSSPFPPFIHSLTIPPTLPPTASTSMALTSPATRTFTPNPSCKQALLSWPRLPKARLHPAR